MLWETTVTESAIRESICRFGQSLFQRGLTPGSSGNITVRLADGGFLSTPTNTSLGSLDPTTLSRLDSCWKLISGAAPTKEIPLHAALYESRAQTGAVVHLHSSHSVAVSMLPEINAEDVLPPLTAYYVMRVGRTALLPYYQPGDPAVGVAIRGLAGRYNSVLLSNHGPVVAGKTLESAVWATEELEESCKLYLLLHNRNPRILSPEECAALKKGLVA